MNIGYLEYLSSLAYAQTSTLSRHTHEHYAQYNSADKVMIKDDITNVRRTLDKMEQELEKEQRT